jgi:hypothetical protein
MSVRNTAVSLGLPLCFIRNIVLIFILFKRYFVLMVYKREILFLFHFIIAYYLNTIIIFKNV